MSDRAHIAGGGLPPLIKTGLFVGVVGGLASGLWDFVSPQAGVAVVVVAILYVCLRVAATVGPMSFFGGER